MPYINDMTLSGKAKRFLSIAVVGLLLSFPIIMKSAARAQPPVPAGPKSETRDAFDHYIRLTEARVSAQLSPDGPFLALDALPAAERDAAYAALRRGEVRIDRVTALDNGQRMPCPGGMIHDWTGIVFVPGVSLDQTMRMIEDYGHDAEVYSPEIVRSQVLSHAGGDFHVYFRLHWKAIITVVLDTEHDIHNQRISPTREFSRSVSTRVQEVAEPGSPSEHDLPEEKSAGYLWRTNGYWKFQERDGGTYVQCEIVSLTRDVPFGLGWLIDPFVQSIPRQSLRLTLESTRNHLLPAGGSAEAFHR